jgi:regulator of sirC expression with transglutaminase-like and TPR domain
MDTEALRGRFAEVVAVGNDIDLGEAALLIGAEEDPPVDIAGELARLDALAAGVTPRLHGFRHPRDRLELVLAYLVRELGFRGNDADYYDPRNSYLHAVLRRRVGLPITLTVLLMEVGRRVGLRIAGVGLPAHFLAIAQDLGDTYVDMFHGGRVFGEAECRQLLRQKTDGAVTFDPGMLQPITSRQILLRMLHNLKGVHTRKNDLGRVIADCDRILLLAPEQADAHRDRGLVQLQRRAFRAAEEDFNSYLRLAPDADDRHIIAARAASARTRARQAN